MRATERVDGLRRVLVVENAPFFQRARRWFKCLKLALERRAFLFVNFVQVIELFLQGITGELADGAADLGQVLLQRLGTLGKLEAQGLAFLFLLQLTLEFGRVACNSLRHTVHFCAQIFNLESAERRLCLLLAAALKLRCDLLQCSELSLQRLECRLGDLLVGLHHVLRLFDIDRVWRDGEQSTL